MNGQFYKGWKKSYPVDSRYPKKALSGLRTTDPRPLKLSIREKWENKNFLTVYHF